MNAITLTWTALWLAAACGPRTTQTTQVTAEATRPAAHDDAVVITLGTRGGPLPTAQRTQSANLLVAGGVLYLIDAGDGVTRRIVESGNDFRKVERVFLTHLHGDHTAGLASLVGSSWEYNRRKPIEVYGSGVAKLVQGTIAYLTPNAEIRWSEGKRTPLDSVVHANEITTGVVYRDDNVTVTAVENTHFHELPDSPTHGTYRSLSFRFDTKTRSVVFTGDTGPSDALIELARGADLLVTEVGDADAVIARLKKAGTWQQKSVAEQEAMIRHLREEHISPAEVGQLATAAGVKRVVLTHLQPTVDPDDDYQRYIAETARTYAGPVVIAQDLARY